MPACLPVPATVPATYLPPVLSPVPFPGEIVITYAYSTYLPTEFTVVVGGDCVPALPSHVLCLPFHSFCLLFHAILFTLHYVLWRTQTE